MPAGEWIALGDIAGDLRRDAQADFAAAHLRERADAALPRSILSVLPASRRRTSASGRVKSRFHSRAFMERSRWPSMRNMRHLKAITKHEIPKSKPQTSTNDRKKE